MISKTQLQCNYNLHRIEVSGKWHQNAGERLPGSREPEEKTEEVSIIGGEVEAGTGGIEKTRGEGVKNAAG